MRRPQLLVVVPPKKKRRRARIVRNLVVRRIDQQLDVLAMEIAARYGHAPKKTRRWPWSKSQ